MKLKFILLCLLLITFAINSATQKEEELTEQIANHLKNKDYQSLKKLLFNEINEYFPESIKTEKQYNEFLGTTMYLIGFFDALNNEIDITVFKDKELEELSLFCKKFGINFKKDKISISDYNNLKNEILPIIKTYKENYLFTGMFYMLQYIQKKIDFIQVRNAYIEDKTLNVNITFKNTTSEVYNSMITNEFYLIDNNNQISTDLTFGIMNGENEQLMITNLLPGLSTTGWIFFNISNPKRKYYKLIYKPFLEKEYFLFDVFVNPESYDELINMF